MADAGHPAARCGPDRQSRVRRIGRLSGYGRPRPAVAKRLIRARGLTSVAPHPAALVRARIRGLNITLVHQAALTEELS